jgi:hypothetical protein
MNFHGISLGIATEHGSLAAMALGMVSELNNATLGMLGRPEERMS